MGHTSPPQPRAKSPKQSPVRRRRPPAPLLVLLAALLAAAVLPQVAAAAPGSYQVPVCDSAPGGVNNSWVWATTDTSPTPHYAEHSSCPYTLGGTGGTRDQESGLSTTDALELHDGAPPQTSAAWTTTAPQGTTFTGITYEPYIGHEIDPFNDWSPALRADGNIIPSQTCLDTIENNDSCFIGGPPGQGGTPEAITGLSAHQLSLGITCQAPPGQECVTGATLHSAWAAMYGATVTITDPTPPTLDTPTGSLWEPGTANGYHHATENLTTTAHDQGGGIQNITLAADGQTLATYTAPCDYTHNQPCPLTTEPQTLTLDTTKIPDGTHTLTLTTTDAANNTSTALTNQITIDNNPPPPPTELTTTPTSPNASTFTATWEDPPGQVAPITAATYQICPNSGPGACNTPTTAPARGPITVATPGPGVWRLSVWLTDAAGNTSTLNAAYATLTVPEPRTASTVNDPSDHADNGGSGSKTGEQDGLHSRPPKPRLAEALHGHRLAVRVTEVSTATLEISYTASYRGKRIAYADKKAKPQHGHLRLTFNLPSRAVAHAMMIQVTVRSNHDTLATSTLLLR
jgi:hypothetical protein